VVFEGQPCAWNGLCILLWTKRVCIWVPLSLRSLCRILYFISCFTHRLLLPGTHAVPVSTELNAASIVALWWQQQDLKEWHGAVTEEVQVRYPEKVLNWEADWALEQAPQGNGHGLRLLEFKKCLDSVLRHRIWILRGAVWSQELDSVILVCPSQLRIFYVSVILWHLLTVLWQLLIRCKLYHCCFMAPLLHGWMKIFHPGSTYQRSRGVFIFFCLIHVVLICHAASVNCLQHIRFLLNAVWKGDLSLFWKHYLKKSVLLLTREELGLNPDRSSALLFLSFLPIPPSHLFNIAWPLLKVVNAMSHSLSLNFLSRSCHSPFSQVVRSKDNKKKKEICPLSVLYRTK